MTVKRGAGRGLAAAFMLSWAVAAPLQALDPVSALVATSAVALTGEAVGSKVRSVSDSLIERGGAEGERVGKALIADVDKIMQQLVADMIGESGKEVERLIGVAQAKILTLVDTASAKLTQLIDHASCRAFWTATNSTPDWPGMTTINLEAPYRVRTAPWLWRMAYDIRRSDNTYNDYRKVRTAMLVFVDPDQITEDSRVFDIHSTYVTLSETAYTSACLIRGDDNKRWLVDTFLTYQQEAALWYDAVDGRFR